MSKSIVWYMHVHQPYRVRHYSIFDIGNNHNYFDAAYDEGTNNERIIHKVARKSYLPTNQKLLKLLHEHPDFKLSLSITGTVLEQLERWAPDALQSFKDLTATGRVEIVAETYHHSLAFLYSRSEFETQVQMHREKIQQIFGQTPQVFRNTELTYNNELGQWADQAGYKGVLAEGWPSILGWRNANYVYRPVGTQNTRLLLRNYQLSDDIGFRFGNKHWSGWPLTADKFVHWLNNTYDATNFNLFMDYETFGEHQWDDTGIFNFLEHLPKEWLKTPDHTFMTVSEVIDANQPVESLSAPGTVTWADSDRDLSAWLGNGMQNSAIESLYGLEKDILASEDLALINDFRRLQTSDHFYYMCVKWFTDGDVHAYFSPYESPYDAFISFMNAYHDLKFRLSEKGVAV